MDKSKFDFSVGKTDIPAITLLTSGISFNQLCIAALGEPKQISIGIDRENKILAIKALDKIDDKSFCCYNFVISDKKKKYLMISATKLRSEIMRLIEIKPARKGIKFTANFDINTKMLIIDLKQKEDK